MATNESGNDADASPDDSGFVRVADADDLRDDSPQIVQADGSSVALFFHEGKFHAVDNRCPHTGLE
jgi:nitrite reductase/ring-hydroxylating ferredoxin subunit